MLHLPILRFGQPYRSLDVASVPDFRSREPFVTVSQANGGLVRRDLLPQHQARMKAALDVIPVAELVARTKRAAEIFAHDTLPVGDEAQTPDDYVRQLSATTGLPHVMVRRNLEKIRGVMSNVDIVLAGLTRGLPLDILDTGAGEISGHAMGFVSRGDTLGVVLPSNSPGVHALWAPTLALKTALVLKPGSAEPWSPYRMIQAFIKAGMPPEAFGYYPTDHASANEILRRCGRGMVFGDVSSTKRWAKDPRVEVHGPGYSKVVIGPDQADDWERYLDVMASSIAENSGRSCVNASGVWVTKHGRAIAEALGARLARVVPRAPEDPEADLAPFADPRVAERISAMVDQGLREPGAEDVTQKHRGGRARVAHFDGGTYLLPTIVHCEQPEHPLANREFLFPFASVVEVPAESMPEILGPTLAAALISDDEGFCRRFFASHDVHRLNLGAVPTQRVAWDQPHEGNLFEHLWARRALQRATA